MTVGRCCLFRCCDDQKITEDTLTNYCQTSILFLNKGATLVNKRANRFYTLAGSPAWGLVLNPPSCLYLDNPLYIYTTLQSPWLWAYLVLFFLEKTWIFANGLQDDWSIHQGGTIYQRQGNFIGLAPIQTIFLVNLRRASFWPPSIDRVRLKTT